MNYNKTFVLSKDIAATAAGQEFSISFPQSFMIRKMWIVTSAAGVAAAHAIAIKDVTSSTTYATITVGTTAAPVVQEALVAEASRVWPGGTVLRVITTTNESTGKYRVYVSGAHNE